MTRIGITGHQQLRPGSRDWAWIEAAMRDVAREHGITCAVGALAVGADQRFARIALQLGAEIEVIIPCRGYADGFGDTNDRLQYQQLLDAAAAIHRLNRRVCDEFAFQAAGEATVALSDVMVTLWDGRPARGIGGTGDIVAHARDLGRRVVHIDPQRGTITAT